MERMTREHMRFVMEVLGEALDEAVRRRREAYTREAEQFYTGRIHALVAARYELQDRMEAYNG